MKKIAFALLAALLLCVLAACGGSRPATKGASGGTVTVSQIMAEAEQQSQPPLPPSRPPENAAGSAPTAEAEPAAQEPPQEQVPAADGVDVDLTQMNATMVYAEVANIMYDPDHYIGKTIRMAGLTSSAEDPGNGVIYHAVIIQDATACCASGLEYALSDGQEYPEDGVTAVVTGEFELYEENGVFYCRLKDAAIG